MAKTIEEFREDLRLLKQDLYQNAEMMDIRLLASFLDRLIVSLDELSDRIEATEISIEEMSESEVCSCCEDSGKAAPRQMPAMKKKPAKKKAKMAKKRKK